MKGQNKGDRIQKLERLKIEVSPVVYALLSEFLIRAATSECECGPFPGNGETCLDLSKDLLREFNGMEEPCWPCQARKVSAQIDEQEQTRLRKASPRQGESR